jgi:hypothetical protein
VDDNYTLIISQTKVKNLEIKDRKCFISFIKVISGYFNMVLYQKSMNTKIELLKWIIP